MNYLNIKSNVLGKERLVLIIAILSPLMAGISDFFLLYHPNLFQKTINYQFLFEIAFEKSFIGALLGAVFIPSLWITYKKAISFLDLVSKKQIQKFEYLVKYLILFGFLVHFMYFFIPLVFKTPSHIQFYYIFIFKLLELIFIVLYNYYMYHWTMFSFKKENIILYRARFFNPFIYLILILFTTLINLNLGIVFIVSYFNISFLIVLLGVYLNRK
jgi:hypothetical protein